MSETKQPKKRRIKRKILIVLLGIVGLAWVLIHTSPVERLIWRQIAALAQANGYRLQADRLDLNLFTISVRLQGLKVEGPGVKAELEELTINGTAALLSGKLEFDSVLLQNGNVELTPFPASEPSKTPSAGPFSLPKIKIGTATISQIDARYLDQSAKLDYAVNDFELNYKAPTLESDFVSAPFTVSGREIPRMEIRLHLNTEDFTSFEDISLAIRTERSLISLTGAIDRRLTPDLQLTADLGDDLLPELSGLSAEIGLVKNHVNLAVKTQIPLGGDPLPVAVKTEFDYRDDKLQAPVSVLTNGLGGIIHVTLDGEDLSADWKLGGSGDLVNQLVPNVLVSRLDLEGKMEMPGLNVDNLKAMAALKVGGYPDLDLDLKWRDGKLYFEGQGKPVPGGYLTLNGTLWESGMAAQVAGGVSDIQKLRAVIPEIPPELCMNGISFNGELASDFVTVSFSNMAIEADDVQFEGTGVRRMTVLADGPLADLNVALSSPELNSQETAVWARLNLETATMHETYLNLRDTALTADEYLINATLQGVAEGPFEKPLLQGEISAQIFDIEIPLPLAQVDCGLNLGETIGLENLRITSANAKLEGDLITDWLGEKWYARLDIQTTRTDSNFETLIEGEPPLFYMSLEGDEQYLAAEVSIPEQVYNLDGTPITFGAVGSANVEAYPQSREMTGRMEGLQVSGFGFSNIKWDLSDERIFASARFQLRDRESFNALLKNYMPEDFRLRKANGFLRLTSDLSFEDPELRVSLRNLEGLVMKQPFRITGANAIYARGQLETEPFTLNVAGIEAEVQSLTETDVLFEGLELQNDDAFQLSARFYLQDWESTAKLLGDQVPPGSFVDVLEGRLILLADTMFENPRVGLELNAVQAYHEGQLIAGENIRLVYDEYIQPLPFDLWLGETLMTLEPTHYGWHIQATPSARELALWLPDFKGDTSLTLELDWIGDLPDGCLVGSAYQAEGHLIYTDPWLDMTELGFAFAFDDQWNLRIQSCKGKLNGGTISIEGEIGLMGETPTVKLDFFAQNVFIDLYEYRASIISNMRWHTTENGHELIGTILIDDGFANPDIRVKGIVRDLISGHPELYFPDPFLEAIALKVAVRSVKPIIVDHSDGYLEIEVPSLLLAGNLAEPIPDTGIIYINEGSSLNLGQDPLLFQKSQIQYHPSRVGDPYFQIFLEYGGDHDTRQPISIVGYSNELSENLSTTDITAFLLNYLGGKTSTVVSLESEINETLLSEGVTFVVSKPLSRTVVTRVTVPVASKKDVSNRYEIGLGPYDQYYMNFIRNEEKEMVYDLRRTIKRGAVGEKPETAKRVIFEQGKTLPKWVRKQFKIRRGDVISNTRIRRAIIDLERELKKRGFLDSKVSVSQNEKNQIMVDIEWGPLTTVTVSGCDFDQAMIEEILLRGNFASAGLERMAKTMAIQKGFRDAEVITSYHDQNLHIEVIPGPPINEPQVQFGEAKPILADMFKDKKTRRELVKDYQADAASVHVMLRARMAAKGYISPKFKPGFFDQHGNLTIPIEPGPRAVLKNILQNGEPYQSDLVGKPFDSGLLSDIRTELDNKLGSDYFYRLKPIRDEDDVMVEITSTLKKDPRIQSLQVTGNNRIKDEEVVRALNFKMGMTQKDLIKNQQDLIREGTFRVVRLIHGDNTATVEVEERNRWDTDFILSYNEEKGGGIGVQFKDRMLFNRLHEFTLRLDHSEIEDRAATELFFRKIFQSPFNARFSAQWDRENEDLSPFRNEVPLGFFTEVREDFGETTRLRFELRYPVSRRQEWVAALLYRQDKIRLRDSIYYDIIDPEAPLGTPDEVINLDPIITQKVPVELSWVYNNFDHPTDPRNGVLLLLTSEYYPEPLGSDGIFVGVRLSGKLTHFKTFGPARWMQRYEAGFYRPKDGGELTGGEGEGLLFALGGRGSIRGFKDDVIAPNYFNGDADQSGGQSMAFLSQELHLSTGWNGIGIVPFMDAGWVWERYDDLLSSKLVITGGIGITYESPIGLIRLDWAKPISDSVLSDAQRQNGLREFHFNFGRTF